MLLHRLKPAAGSTKTKKRIGRGQGSGNGKTAGKGGKGQTARSGYKAKRGFEGGQQPIHRRLPKIGFISKVEKPLAINVEKIASIASLEEITVESIRTVFKVKKDVTKIKLIGKTAQTLKSKIKDSNVFVTGK